MSLENKEIFAKNLKYYMDLNNISRNDLVEKLDLKYMTISDWINANSYPRIDKIELLANFFGIEKSDLIEEKTTDSNTSFKEMVVMGFDGLDVSKMTEEERENYKQDLLDMMNLVTLKYKDKK